MTNFQNQKDRGQPKGYGIESSISQPTENFPQI